MHHHLQSNVFEDIDCGLASSTDLSAIILARDECAEGVPSAAIDVRQARELVHDRTASPVIRNAIWTSVLVRTRLRPQHWQSVAIWIMLPGLGAIARRLRRIWRLDIADIRSEVLVGFVEALRQTDPNRNSPGTTLWWATYRHARAACQRSVREIPREDLDDLVARSAVSDHSNTPPSCPVSYGVVEVSSTGEPSDRAEGERIGSIAERLGLRDRIRDRGAAQQHGRIIDYRTYRRRTRTILSQHARSVSARGNGEGDAA
ncbi:hypothetical protein [Amycolatopsis anabasis]|uniref:hypothetical protein n=1 Tax=Amycolatopsis anabasis TaxID=1840409 RepID=UPI00131B400F|nr:hypothetical protein [Amycolatopsis anabasis]